VHGALPYAAKNYRREAPVAESRDVLERLEQRVMLAVSAVLDNSVLTVRAGPGNDVITIDLADGQLSVRINSAVFAAPAADVKRICVYAEAGNDRVTIAQTVRIRADLWGGPGNDQLSGGPLPCRLYGETGHDTLLGGGSKDVLVGGAGVDTVDYSSRTQPLRISLDGRANDGEAPREGYAGEFDNIAPDVENVRGGSGDDSIVGSNGRNTLIGGAGNDTLSGLGGDDVLVGGDGDDLLLGGDGDDILLGIDANAGDTLDGGDGYDSATVDLVNDQKDSLLNIEDEVQTLLRSTS